MICGIRKFHIPIIILILIGCNTDNGSVPEVNQGNLDKSPKRGLAFNLLAPADFDMLRGGVSWRYNWYFETDAPQDYYADYQMEFIPMLWGGNSERDYNQVKNFILDRPEIKYLLVLNEPNLRDQANQSPAHAARIWKQYEQTIDELKAMGRTVYLVGPAMNWGTMTDFRDPVTWLDAF